MILSSTNNVNFVGKFCVCTLWGLVLAKKICKNINKNRRKFPDYIISCDYAINYCILDNHGDVEKMFSGLRAILEHVLSTADNHPKQEDCPKVSTSCCSYQRDLGNVTQKDRLIQNPIASATVEKVQLLVKKIGDKYFLTAVEKCYTTNVN